MPVSPSVRPYLDEFPLPNGANLGGGLAAYTFPFTQTIDEDYFQVRLDQNLGQHDKLFLRYTYDQADQFLPTDFPQFPRTFVSRNQFATAEYSRVFSSSTLATFRLGYSRTRIGQEVEANTSQPLSPFVPGRESMGAIDIGGIPRFGPQVSAERLDPPGRVRLQRRRRPQPRAPHAEGRHPGRALPVERDEPDLQPRHPLVRQPRGLPAKPIAPLHRPHSRGRPRPRVAVHALRAVRAGRDPPHRAAHGQRRACATSTRPCPATRGTGT